MALRRWVGLLLAGSTVSAAAQAPSPPSPLSHLESGGFYHHVSNGFGSWKGGYARAVLAGAHDVWYLDAKAQEAFRDKGVYGSLANVHSFGAHLYTQLGVGGGTGQYVLPKVRFDGALTLKLGPPAGRAVLLTVGGTYLKSKSIYEDHALFGSLGWYLGRYALLEAGGRVNWSDPGAVRSERVSGALTLGHPGAAILTLRGGAGTEGYQLTGAAETLQRFRSQEAGLTLRQWLAREVGIVLGGEWYHNPFYTRAGGSLGFFYAW